MKTKIKILSIIALILAVFLSCSEDIYIHEQDGKDGTSYVYNFNFKQIDNCLTAEVYQNDSLIESSEFCFDFEIPNYPIPSFWYEDIPLNEGCYQRNWHYKINDVEYLAGQDTICEEALPVFSTELIHLNELCKIWVFYADEIELFRDTVCSGQDGETPELIFSTEIIPLDSLCKIRIVHLNENIFYQDTICNGQSAEPYIPVFSTELIHLNELCKLRKIYLDGELFYSDTICDGKPGEIKSKTIIRESFFENCNNPGNSPYYLSLGWIFNEFFSINQVGSNSGNGTLVYSGSGKDTIWSPKIFSEPMSLDSLCFYFGSRNSFDIQIALMNSFGEVIIIDKIETSENNKFDWQKLSSYTLFKYSIDLENLEFHNIMRIGFIVKNLSSKKCTGRNYELNIDNIFARGVKIVEPILGKGIKITAK